MLMSPTEGRTKGIRCLHVLAVIPVWLVCTQLAALIFVKGGSSKASAIFAILAAAGLGTAMFLQDRKQRVVAVLLAVIGFGLSWLSYPQGREQYAITTCLKNHGYEMGDPQDKQRYLDDVDAGRLDVIAFMKEIARAKANPPSTVELVVFKTKRYARNLLWPRTQFLADQSIK